MHQPADHDHGMNHRLASRNLSRPAHWLVLAGVLVLGQWLSSSWLAAEPTKARPGGKSKSTAAAIQELDSRKEKLQEQFLEDAYELAKGYRENNQPEKAKSIFEILIKVDPTLTRVSDTLKELDEQIMKSNDFDITYDVGKSGGPMILVTKDKPFRVLVEGDFKVSLNLSGIKADGIRPGAELKHELIAGIPFGGLMGVVGKDGQFDPDKDKPFYIGDKNDITPKESGVLAMKLNLPNACKATGRLKLKISGSAKLAN